MSTITLQNIRVSSDLTVGVRLKDSGVAIDWSTLSNIKAYIYADAQRAMAGRCAVSIDAEDSTRLVCSYRANKPQYIGVNRIVITCTYRGETKTYDKPALNFVRWTDDQAGQQITIDDPDIEVEIDVEDVSSTILENAIAAAIQAAADAEHAAHLIPNQVLLDCEEATTEANAAKEAAQQAAEAANAAGITSVQASMEDNEPGTPSVDVSLLNKVLTLVFHYLKGAKGDTGATPAISIGTVATGEPGSNVVVTITGTVDAPVLNFTIPQGLKGDTGVSADYPITIHNGLDSDATDEALAAAQGKILDGKVSQLEHDVADEFAEVHTEVGRVEITDITKKKYVALAVDVGQHIGIVHDSNSWNYLRFPVSQGDWVIVNGVGGATPRLWAFIDEDEIVLAVADANVSGSNLKLVAPANTAECIINTSDISTPSYIVKQASLQGQVGTLSELATNNKGNIVGAINETITDIGTKEDKIYLTPVEGEYYYGGTDVGISTIPSPTSISTYASLKLSVQPGEQYLISAKGGSGARLYYLYDAQGKLTRVAESNLDTRSNPLQITIGATERTLIVNIQVAETPYWVRYPNFADTVTRHTQDIADINGDIADLNGDISDINGDIAGLDRKIDNAEVATSLVSWTAKRFIKNTPEVISTSVTNSVGSIDVAGKKIVSFNFSVKNGGGASTMKLGWYIADANGSIVAKSEEYAGTTLVPATDVEMRLPDSAKTLYISWNNDLTDAQYTIFSDSIKDLYERVDELEDEVNIENLEVRTFEAARYNDADYSYTKCPYPDSSSYDNHIAFSYPNAIVLDTPVDDNAVSRSLEFADNPGYSNSRVISLDLVSTQFSLTNLEGGKIYYWRVYKDATVTALLSSGWFKTEGHIRDLLIKANSNFDKTYIENVRELGGWNTCDGKRIRYGCIFRGYELNHKTDGVVTSYISQDGIDELKALGVGAELDLRENDYLEESALGSDVAYAGIGVDLFFYRLNIYNKPVSNLVRFKRCLQQIITWLAAGKGIYIHCQGGCDRTGFLCALIEGICGVSENDINHDYELSGRNRSREYYTIAGGDDYDGDFKFAIEYIKGLLEYNGNIYVYYRGNYYDPTATVTDYTPVPISDASLIAALDALPFGTFKQCWRRLMKIGGVDMTEREFDKLEQLLCS